MSLATSPIPAIRTFGLISAAGVMFIYFVVIIILPPIFARWDTKPWPHSKAGLRWMDLFVRFLYRLGIRHPVWIVLLTTTGLGAGIPALWQIKVETSLQEFFTPEHPVRRDTDHFEAKMSGTGTLDVVFETAERDGLKNPEYLAFMRSFQILGRATAGGRQNGFTRRFHRGNALGFQRRRSSVSPHPRQSGTGQPVPVHL